MSVTPRCSSTRPGRLPLLLSLALLLAPLALLLAPRPAAAANPLSTQHGGRATAQVGAFTARASDPSAVTYNPAAISRLPGLQVLAGLDFSNATDDYESATGSFSANHTIQFPPAVYVTYGLPIAGWERVTVGLGVDTPAWYSVDWDPALYPGRFETREQKLRLWEVHPVVAWEIDDNWAVGGGLRYLTGNLDQGVNFPGTFGGTTFEGVATLEGSVDALTFDLGVHYDTPVWGWGATYRHGAELEGRDDLEVLVRDPSNPDRADDIAAQFRGLTAFQSFELPPQLTVGAWIAPYPELRLELDAAHTGWSTLRETDLIIGNPFDGAGGAFDRRIRDWDDVFSLRLGVEGDLSDAWTVSGGVAHEPSPVPDSRVEPGFPRGDALVYGAGFTYNLPNLSFDVGYSFWDYDDRDVVGQEAARPNRVGTYSAREQVWSVSARWRL